MTDSTHSSVYESLSSLVDGEHNDIDLQRVLKAMDHDPAVRDAWSRYHRIGLAMRREGASAAAASGEGFAASVMARLSEEPQPALSADAAGVWQWVGKGAVAASVMLAVVFTAQQWRGSEPVASVQSVALATGSPGSAVPHGFELPPLSARAVSTNPFTSQSTLPRSPAAQTPGAQAFVNGDIYQLQVNRLLYKHAEQVSNTGAMGVLPFTRVSEVAESSGE